MEANTSAHLALVEDVDAEEVIDAMRGIIHMGAWAPVTSLGPSHCASEK